MEKLGIDNIKLAASSVSNFLSVVGEVFVDGKATLSDLANLPEMIEALLGLGAIDVEKLKKEVNDLDSAEIKDLADHFAKVFDLADDDLEKAIEDGVKIIADAANLFILAKKFGKKI